MKKRQSTAAEEGFLRYKSDPLFREQVARGRKGLRKLKSALSHFAEQGDLDMIRDLMGRGVPVDASGESGFTPLGMAASTGQVEAVRLLMEYGASPNFVGPHGITPLIMAAAMGHTEMVSFLLEHGADVNARSNNSQTALHEACGSEKLDMIARLVEAGADVLLEDSHKVSPLQHAVYIGSTEMIKLLLRSDVSFCEPNSPGMGACVAAVKQGNLDALEILFEHGASVESTVNSLTLLHFAVYQAKTEMVKFLLDRGANANEHSNSARYSPLMVACEREDLEIAGLLLERGADANHESEVSETPLTMASKSGQPDMVRLMLDNGADINFRDHRGATPIFGALESGQPDIVIILAAAGADLNIRDSRGRSVLEWAVEKKDIESVTILAGAGADVNAPVGEKSNILELAARQGSKEIVEVLESHGARYPQEMDQEKKRALLFKPEISGAARRGDFDKAVEVMKELVDDEAIAINAQLLLDIAAEADHAPTVKLLLRDYQGLSSEAAFDAAAKNGNKELLKFLIDENRKKGLNLSTSSWEEALKWTVRNGDKVSTKFLTEHYPLRKHNPELGESLLASAAFHGHAQLTKEFWKSGFGRSEGRLTWSGMRVLHEAVQQADQKAINQVLQQGTLTEETIFEFEDSIIGILASRNDIDFAKKLIEKGADVNAPGRNRMTPLMKAANLGNTDMVALLLFKGADVSMVDDNGRTALDHAVSRNRIEIIKLLKASGAKPAQDTD